MKRLDARKPWIGIFVAGALLTAGGAGAEITSGGSSVSYANDPPMFWKEIDDPPS